MKNNNIRKRIRAGLLLIFLASILGACLSTTEINYNDPAPPEKKCTLIIASNFTVTGFDGKSVNWAAASGNDWMTVQIPEGNRVFILNYQSKSRESSYKQENIRYEHAGFTAGRTYRMYGEEGMAGTGGAGIRILRIKVELVK